MSSAEDRPEENIIQIPRGMLIELLFDLFGFDETLEVIPLTFERLCGIVEEVTGMRDQIGSAVVVSQFLRRLP